MCVCVHSHQFKSFCRRGVSVMVLAGQFEDGSSFQLRGTEKVKVLESDLLPRCEETRRRSFSVLSWHICSSEL